MSTFGELLAKYDQRADGRARGSRSWAARVIDKMPAGEILGRYVRLRREIEELSETPADGAVCLVRRNVWLGFLRFDGENWHKPKDWAQWSDQDVAVAVFGGLVEPARGSVLLVVASFDVFDREMSPGGVVEFRSQAGAL